jgi:glycosyltransferase involved in cell wall biosynthesis
MKIAHFAVFSPNLSGMYATVKDLILAERMQGIDAQFIDYNIDADGTTYSKVGLVDGSIITVPEDWAYKEADILVRHSLIIDPIVRVGKPVIMAMHGRPEYSFLLDHYNQSPVMKIMTNHEVNDRYAAYITLWEEHLLFWNLVMPKREITYIPSIVDTKRFTPEGQKFFTPHWTGSPNIVVADMWREDITPFNMILAVEKFRQVYCDTAKLHLFGLPPAGKGFISELADRLRDSGLVGEANVLVPFLDKVYRSADILVTPHQIATRVIREALASGCPIVAGSGCKYTPYTADSRDHDAFAFQINRCWKHLQERGDEIKLKFREIAEIEFGYEKAGIAMKALGEKILKMPKPSLPALEWSGWSLDPTDWVVLRDFLIHRQIKRVVEIGSGLSTELLDRLGVHVLSYETDPIHMERVKKRVSELVVIQQWNGLRLPEVNSGYQLALIDGPVNGENREPSYKAIASSSVQFVACHDYKRKEDKVWIDMYFGDWKEIARADESVQGLLILERV